MHTYFSGEFQTFVVVRAYTRANVFRSRTSKESSVFFLLFTFSAMLEIYISIMINANDSQVNVLMFMCQALCNNT